MYLEKLIYPTYLLTLISVGKKSKQIDCQFWSSNQKSNTALEIIVASMKMALTFCCRKIGYEVSIWWWLRRKCQKQHCRYFFDICWMCRKRKVSSNRYQVSYCINFCISTNNKSVVKFSSDCLNFKDEVDA